VTRGGRRRRAAVLIALALAAGGLAASSVERRERDLDARVGAPVPVVVAAADLPAGKRIGARDATRRLAVRSVPAQFVPPDALTTPEQAVGGEPAAPIPAGGYVTAAALAGGDPARSEDGAGRAPPGQRVVEIAVRGGEDLHAAGEGARVDVLVTSERAEGRGRTYLALEDVELQGARPDDGAGGDDADAPGAATLARVRVTVRQAVFLTAAQVFAREMRLLLRSPGERRRSGPLAVDSGAL
jgi:pilus assembly protein CpaB